MRAVEFVVPADDPPEAVDSQHTRSCKQGRASKGGSCLFAWVEQTFPVNFRGRLSPIRNEVRNSVAV
jgi:hypothetical protein